MTGQSDAAGFDEIAALLNYPMFVVTTQADGHRAGCLVGFTTQVTINPQRFLVCLSDKNHTFRTASVATHLAVHLLPDDQHELARLFGEETGDVTDKFARCRWTPDSQGLPILDDVAAWFVGRICERVPFGDHVGFVLEPQTAEVRNAPAHPVSFADVQDLDAGHEA